MLKATDLLGEFLPKGQVEIEGIVKKALEAGRGAGLLSILPLIWTGSLVFGAVTRALNVAFEVEKKYSFLKREDITNVKKSGPFAMHPARARSHAAALPAKQLPPAAAKPLVQFAFDEREQCNQRASEHAIGGGARFVVAEHRAGR